MAFELVVNDAFATAPGAVNAMARGAGLSVLVTSSGGVYTVSSSPDGVTWTPRQVIGSYSGGMVWTGIAFFFIDYASPLSRMWRSYNGIAWEIVYSSSTVSRYIEGAGGGYVYFGQDSAKYRSADGVSIQAVTGLIDGAVADFVVGAGAVVAWQGSTSYVSTDGLVFTAYPGTDDITSIGWSDSRAEFIRVLDAYPTYLPQYSPDGVVWNNFTDPLGVGFGWEPTVVISGGFTLFVAMASSETPQNIVVIAPDSYAVEGVDLEIYPINYSRMFPGDSNGVFLYPKLTMYWGPEDYTLGKATFSLAGLFWTAFKGQYET